jgi:hypothetical protein
MKVLAIDPGSEQSAYVLYDGTRPLLFGKKENEELRGSLKASELIRHADLLLIEMVASYGMAVGSEVFETVWWTGRFVEAWDDPFLRLYRRDVKLHLCGQARAKDANIRQALIDRFGPGKDKAIGTKAKPGPLYGVRADVWAALAVAVTYCDQQQGAHGHSPQAVG